ncbi:MAG: GtrA family protein [Gammaproteobacteria bacterium]
MQIYQTFSMYIIVGVLNTFTSFAIIFVMLLFGLTDALSNFFGIVGGIFQSIILNSKLTFRQKNLTYYKSLKFFLILLIAYLINLIALSISIDYFGYSSLVAQIIGITCYVTISFLCLNRFLFNKDLQKLE